MKVIFLDIDGVLNSEEYINKIIRNKTSIPEILIDPDKVRILKSVINITGAKVVLISSWRYTVNGEKLKDLFYKNGINVDMTPVIGNKRGLEIKEWLKNNINVEDYIILDDEVWESYDEILLTKLIKISNGNGISLGEGFSKKDAQLIIERFGSQVKKEVEER